MDHLLAHSLHSRLSKTLVRMHLCILTIFLIPVSSVDRQKKSSPLIPSIATSSYSSSLSLFGQ
jgi:hypothetical protein